MRSAREAVEEYYDAYNADDLERFAAVLDPDVEIWTGLVTIRGRAQARSWADEIRQSFPGAVVEHRVRITDGEHVAVELRHTNPNEEEHDWRLGGYACELFTVRGGLVCAMRDYYMPSAEDRTEFAPMPGQVEAHKLADEHAALRQVATLAAAGASDERLFAAVTEGIGRIASADIAALFRFGSDDTLVLIGGWTRQNDVLPVGDRRPLTPEVRELREHGRPMRFEPVPSPAPFGDEAASLGMTSSVSVPIRVSGRSWGLASANSTRPEPLPPDIEDRLMRFAEFVAIALANAESRRLLRESRARVVATADETRRRMQRDVHDGAQQRLVQTALTLTMAQEALGDREPEVAALLAEALHQAELGTVELSELVRGILPAALTRDGLRTGVESLAQALTLPVDVLVDVPRLSPEAETTAYFIVAEALTNVVKHAAATRVEVRITRREGTLLVSICDDGRGGADASAGTGLTGLFDRVDAWEGRLTIDSAPGAGTRIEAALPIGVPDLDRPPASPTTDHARW